MDISKISVGHNPPYDLNVIIEIPQGSTPVKYEIDKASGAVFVDRFVSTAMFYPVNYGFVPHTLSDDGDPIDVLVVSQLAVVAGAVIRVRPIGALMMEDESGHDEKIIAVPVSKLTTLFDDVKTYQDLPELLTLQIAHFFEHYKDLEKGKWVKLTGWVGPERAAELIEAAIKRAED
jgi:inorganic pyrophosphatase